jgi:aspartyl-tRNA synthetase
MADTIKGLKRTHYCGEITAKDIGNEVVLFGWTQRQRDLGGIIFIDLRDRTGIIQLAFDDSTDRKIFEKAFSIRCEFVLAIKGIVRRRDAANSKLATGEIEVAVNDLRLLAKSETPPFEIAENTKVNEELRLKYRYLDLRRPDMQNNLILRHRIVKIARDYYDQNGFIEIETPMLINSTPEGARDYLVPSRVHAGKFYALPQSPQLYKQLLMLSGFDKYFQIARCFRDEDLRADRQPEFTQIDIEMSFVDADDVIAINEGYTKRVFKEVLGIDIKAPFERLSYDKAMELYGSDKPDIRFKMFINNISDILGDCEFKVFASALQGGGTVRAINAKGAFEKLTRKELDKLTEFVKTYGAKGLAWSRINGENSSSSFAKFLNAKEINNIYERLDVHDGDVIMLVCDTDDDVVLQALGALRLKVAELLNLTSNENFKFLWVCDFPLFEYDKQENRFSAKHHPFTAPVDEDIEKLETDKAGCRAKAYDLVLNGVEIGGGSIRINDLGLQQRMFAALGFAPKDAQERFGFLLDAFRYGAPPHGGMAYGLDRLVMLMLGCSSIREVIAFPKAQNASELMTACPSCVDEKQLGELNISILKNGEI